MTKTLSTRAWRRAAIIAVVTVAAGCASVPPRIDVSCGDAERVARDALDRIGAIEATPEGCSSAAWGQECQRQRDRVRRLAVSCASYAAVLVADAWLSYDDHDVERARDDLDAALALPIAQPDAAVLRARLALEDGDVAFALRLSQEQLARTPDHAGLHEVRAASLYAAGRLSDASTELAIAGKLGAPAWRVAYDQGLLAEASGRSSDAVRQYEAALASRPGWPPAAGRLRALEAAADATGTPEASAP
jgi:tetratricopeptide (TPR) repeat protein